MSDIFISYANEDRPHAERLARALEGEGWSVWWDVIIPAGLTFDEVIEEALDAARCVIVIWTERSVGRRWVRTEAEEAVKRNIFVPVRIEEVDPPLAFRRFQARNLIGWDGSAEATECRRLVTDIERVLGPSPRREEKREQEEAEAPRKAEVNWLKWGAGASLMVTGVVIWVAFGSTKQPVIASTPDCDVCPEMVFIPPGEFTMGSPDTEPGHQSDEGPQRRVTVAAFAMGRYEVTRGEYQVFVQATGRAWSPPSYSQTDDHPVVNVSWEDAKAYVDWLSQISRQPYRLPSEAEWEYAARADSTTPWHWGASAAECSTYANGSSSCGDEYTNTAPVGSFPPNGYGLHDMAGNVWDWVADCYHTSYSEAPEDRSAWTSGDCTFRVLRGGSWDDSLSFLRSANRDGNIPTGRYYSFGFRVARTVTR